MKKQAEYQDTLSKINMIMYPKVTHHQLNEQAILINQLTLENDQLKEQVTYLNTKIKQLIKSQIDRR